jgi:biotin operon repressor
MTATTDTTSRWGKIPAWWLDHPDIDADGFAVLAALATFADENGLCWPSQSTLAAKLKRSRPTINRILQRLDDIGLVAIEHRRGRDGARLSCLYRLRLGNPVAGNAAVPPADRDDSPANAPCPTVSHQHLHSEQTPDSPAEPAREPGPARGVPGDWMPGTDDIAWARSRFGDVDLDQHIQSFTLRCQAHGYRYRDIGAAWRAWLMQDAAAGKIVAAKAPPPARSAGSLAPSIGRSRNNSHDNAAVQRVNAWMAAAAQLQGGDPTPDSLSGSWS